MITQDKAFWAETPSLYYQSWVPERVEHVLVVSHGLGEHSGRYEHFARYLAAHRIAVYACDHIGHGESSGQRGHIKSFADYSNFLREFIRFACHKQKVDSVSVLGHSLGAVIVHDMIMAGTEQMNKIMLSNPGYKKKAPIPPYQLWLAEKLTNTIPRLPVGNAVDPEGLSHDSAIVHAYIADPLVHRWVTLNFFREFDATTHALRDSQLADVNNPLLFMLALDDPICDQQVTMSVYEGLTAANKSLKSYPGMWHEPLNEFDRDQVYNDVLAFIRQD